MILKHAVVLQLIIPPIEGPRLANLLPLLWLNNNRRNIRLWAIPPLSLSNRFLGKKSEKEEIVLYVLLTDQCVSEVLPAQSAVATNIPNPSTARLSYNRQIINVSDPVNYRPIDPTAFHWYPPGMNNGIHWSLDVNNKDRSNFNLVSASNQSCLHYANQINGFVIGPTITDEQRCCALWNHCLYLG